MIFFNRGVNLHLLKIFLTLLKPDEISKRGFVPKSALEEVQFEEILKKEE